MVTSVFKGDGKSPIVAGFRHFVSLPALERSSYARDQFHQFFGTSSLLVFDFKGPEPSVGDGHLRGELRFHAKIEGTAPDSSETFGGLFRTAS